MKPEERLQLDRMFNPRGLALFGGISTPVSFGQLILLSQIRYGFKGRLYPISSRGGEIAGLKIYRSLREVEGPVDLAAISVPARAVPQVLRECLDKGVAVAQIHSSGFVEAGEQGAALESEILKIAAQGIRVVGPNCFGIHSPRGGITFLPGFDFSTEPGPVAMISQSGGVATDLAHEAPALGLALSKVVSFGNGCDLDARDFMEYLADDPETGYMAAYLEGIRDGRGFLEILKRVTREKPVVIWKGGLSPLGARAALSHTGSMGGEAGIWKGALAQAGAVTVKGLDEMLDTLVALRYLKNPGPRLALLGGGGAIGVFASDLAHRQGLQIPAFSRGTQKRLRNYFPTPGNSMANPLDTGSPALPPDTVRALAEEILTHEPVDVLVMVVLVRTLEKEVPAFYTMNGLEPPGAGSYLRELLDPLTILKRETGREIVMVFENRAHLPEEVEVEKISRKMQQRYQSQGIPVYPSAERALRGISGAVAAMRFMEHRRGRRISHGPPGSPD
ncbi:MAG TPA: hypothetical protein ENH37_02260 [Deltaproteobacteria bacterium]|nr:hypothetical protein [Deltaproteobacteria bacterium]